MLFVCFVLFATIGGLEYICASLLIEEIADAWLSHLCEHGGDVIAVDGHKVLIRAVFNQNQLCSKRCSRIICLTYKIFTLPVCVIDDKPEVSVVVDNQLVIIPPS